MAARKRILCVADSLSLPREGVPYDVTWVYKLRESLPEFDVAERCQRGLTSAYLRKYGEYLEFYNPDIVVLQVGIVDCAPRYLPGDSKWLKIINSLPKPLKAQFWKTFKKMRDRKAGFADVMPADFYKNIDNYCKRCENINVSQVIIIKIAHPGSAMISKNKGILDQVKLYNDLLDTLDYPNVKVIDPINVLNDGNFIADGYHLNGNGAEAVTQMIISTIKPQI